MTDLLNIAKECGAIFEGTCQACGGSGVVMETITIPVCCGRFSPHGDCCGNPDPRQDYQPAQCGCGGITFLHLSTAQLHATVEKVCGPLVEALTKIDSGGEGVYKWSMTKAEITAQIALASYKKLMGQDK